MGLSVYRSGELLMFSVVCYIVVGVSRWMVVGV